MQSVDAYPQQWRLKAIDTLVWQPFDKEFILYHRENGDTHVVDQVGFSLIEALEASGVVSKDRLVTLVADALNFEVSGEFSEHVTEVLEKLEQLDILVHESSD